MNDSEETVKQDNEVLKAITELSRKLEALQQSTDVQLEAIRQGLAADNVSFDRLRSTVFALRADSGGLKKEIRRDRKVSA